MKAKIKSTDNSNESMGTCRTWKCLERSEEQPSSLMHIPTSEEQECRKASEGHGLDTSVYVFCERFYTQFLMDKGYWDRMVIGLLKCQSVSNSVRTLQMRSTTS